MKLYELSPGEVKIGIKVKCGGLIGTIVDIKFMGNELYADMLWSDDKKAYWLPYSFYQNPIIYHPDWFIVSRKNDENS